MKMYVLDNGEIRMEAANPVTADGGMAAIPVHCFLIESSQGYILFDTGCDPDGMEKDWPAHIRANPYIAGENGTVSERLAQLGIKTSDIRYVVLSHLHLDHAGSLKFFTNAEIIVSAEEFKKTLRDYANRDFSGFYMKTDIESWLKAELDFHLIDSKTEELALTEEIRILNFGSGHSYGMLGLMVTLKKSGRFILASDAIYTRTHIGPPVQIAGIAYDAEGYVKTVNRIVALSEKENATILFGHDMKQFKTLIKSTEGYYD